MDVENLQIFIEVMRKGSFTAVARDLNVAPSTISRAMANLEEELGVRLLQRTTRQIRPTEAGRVYFQRVEPLVDELEQARSVTIDLGQNPTGNLRVTAPMTFGNTALVPLLPAFMQRYPRLSLYLDLSDAVIDIVDEGIDVAIRLGHLDDTGLVATRLAKLDYVITASPDYLDKHGIPIEPEDIRQHKCLGFPMTGQRSDWLFRDATGHITAVMPNSHLQITNALALKQCAVAGMGITMSSHWSVWQEIRDGSLVQLFTDYDTAMIDFDNAVWLVYPTRHYLPLKVRVFIDYLKEQFSHGRPWD